MGPGKQNQQGQQQQAFMPMANANNLYSPLQFGPIPIDTPNAVAQILHNAAASVSPATTPSQPILS